MTNADEAMRRAATELRADISDLLRRFDSVIAAKDAEIRKLREAWKMAEKHVKALESDVQK